VHLINQYQIYDIKIGLILFYFIWHNWYKCIMYENDLNSKLFKNTIIMRKLKFIKLRDCCATNLAHIQGVPYANGVNQL
jgi:hypothetical protein